MAAAGFPRLYSSSQSPKQLPPRKYMQGPVVKAQHPNLFPIFSYKKEEKKQAKNPHVALRQWRRETPSQSPLPISAASSPISSSVRGPSADGVKQPDGTWARTGEYVTLVSKDSALLGLPQAVEERVAARGDHSTMVKFSSRNNPNYSKALGSLHRLVKEAKAVVERHFCSGKW